MHMKRTLTSLGMLLVTLCSYLLTFLGSQWLLYAPPCLKFGSIYFCPQSASVCLTWNAESIYVAPDSQSKLSLRSLLFCFVTLRVSVEVHWRFGTTCPPRIQEPKGSRKNRGFSVYFGFPMPPMLHSHLHLYISLTRRIKGRILGTFLKAMFF
jgi:hypothetical protein